MAKYVAIALLLIYISGTTKCNPLKSRIGDDLNCMPGFQDIVYGSDKCYYVSDVDDYQGWDDALDACNGMIDHSYDVVYNGENTGLVSIDSNQENNDLFDQLTLAGIESAWIGLSWTEESDFIWNNDESCTPSHFNWAPGEPNTNPDYTNYVQLMSWTNDQGAIAGKWLIPDDQTVANYICQAPKVSLSTTPWYETTTPSTDLVCMNGYEDVYPTDNKCYYFSQADDLKSWEDAFQACDDMMVWEAEVEKDSLNCHLVSIDSQEQHQALSKRLKHSDLQAAWIGLSWTEEGNWTWNSDDTEAYPSYFNWEHGEPNLNPNLILLGNQFSVKNCSTILFFGSMF